MSRVQRCELLHGIYAILNDGERLPQLARGVLDAGVRVVQYRAKNGIDATRLAALRRLTRERGALLILNDAWQAANAFDCDGVHLGPQDEGFANVARVRAAMPERLIGLSCGTLREVRAANAAGADYLGVGSVYATVSKSDAGVPIGTQTLSALVRASIAPVAAIGGIGCSRIAEVRDTQVAMAAVISAIADAPDPELAARELVRAWSA